MQTQLWMTSHSWDQAGGREVFFRKISWFVSPQYPTFLSPTCWRRLSQPPRGETFSTKYLRKSHGFTCFSRRRVQAPGETTTTPACKQSTRTAGDEPSPAPPAHLNKRALGRRARRRRIKIFLPLLIFLSPLCQGKKTKPPPTCFYITCNNVWSATIIHFLEKLLFPRDLLFWLSLSRLWYTILSDLLFGLIFNHSCSKLIKKNIPCW